MILVLMLLAVGITLNLLGLFIVPAFGGRARPTGGFATGALAAFVATPCAGPFLGAALGTALLLPPIGSLLVFAALGLGLAMPFVAVAFIPALRNRLPKPGPWMERLQRFLAIPMAATAVACLWLLWRVGGWTALQVGLVAAAVMALCLVGAGLLQRKGKLSGYWAAMAAVAVAVAAVSAMPQRSAIAERAIEGVEQWSEAAVADSLRQGHPVFVYFTADWCLTCKVNEAAAIDRSEVKRRVPRVRRACLCGRLDRRRPGDHPLHRGPGPRRRAALSVVRTERSHRGTAAGPDPGDAYFPRSPPALAARSQTFLPATQVSRTCVRASACGSAVETSRSTRMKSAHLPGSRLPILSSAKLGISRAAGETVTAPARSSPAPAAAILRAAGRSYPGG